jgi:hypothetical protein
MKQIQLKLASMEGSSAYRILEDASLFSLSQLMSCARGVVVVHHLQQILHSKLVTFAIRSICGVSVQIIFSYFPVHQTANRFLYMSIAHILNSNFHQQNHLLFLGELI